MRGAFKAPFLLYGFQYFLKYRNNIKTIVKIGATLIAITFGAIVLNDASSAPKMCPMG
jgi:hypothetical protein